MRIVQKPTRDRAWLNSGAPSRDRDDIIGNGYREGSEEETDDPVAVEPGEYGVGHPVIAPVEGFHTALPKK